MAIIVPPREKKNPDARMETNSRAKHFDREMDNQSFHLKHFLALLLALIPLAVVVGACVTCP
ncbi:MAG: hypothetical protein ACTHM8_04930 [Sphingomonas sp.]